MLRRNCFFLMLLLVSAGLCFGDSISVGFDLDQNLNPIPSEGTITLVLNGDGTIGASLLATGGPIIGIGINTDSTQFVETTASGYTVTQWDSFLGGVYQTGLACPESDPSLCPLSLTWTISSQSGPFTSVFDLFALGSSAPTQFVMFEWIDNQGFESDAGVPEPGTVGLMGAGLLAAIALFRRRRKV